MKYFLLALWGRHKCRGPMVTDVALILRGITNTTHFLLLSYRDDVRV